MRLFRAIYAKSMITFPPSFSTKSSVKITLTLKTAVTCFRAINKLADCYLGLDQCDPNYIRFEVSVNIFAFNFVFAFLLVFLLLARYFITINL